VTTIFLKVLVRGLFALGRFRALKGALAHGGVLAVAMPVLRNATVDGRLLLLLLLVVRRFLVFVGALANVGVALGELLLGGLLVVRRFLTVRVLLLLVDRLAEAVAVLGYGLPARLLVVCRHLTMVVALLLFGALADRGATPLVLRLGGALMVALLLVERGLLFLRLALMEVTDSLLRIRAATPLDDIASLVAHACITFLDTRNTSGGSVSRNGNEERNEDGDGELHGAS
jgi:hypothetical protein